MNLSRRQALAGAGALALAPLLSSQAANAEALATGKQVAGIYRYKVGSFECTSINDGARSFPMPDKFVTNVPKEKALEQAEGSYMPKGMVTVPFNPQLINTGTKLVLIDTGNGPVPNAPVGMLMPNLIAAGIDPKSIDVILLSHLHPDHTNGLRAADGGLAFPNAEIMAPSVDWAFWTSDENAAQAPNDVMKNYFANVRKTFAGIGDKVTRFEWGKEVVPGITAIATPGHTPGHTSFAVASGGSTVLIQSDVTNIPEFFMTHPDWHMMYDADPELAQKTRHTFYDMASAEKATVVGFHFQFPSVGHVEKSGTGYRLVPAAWNPTI